MARTLEEALRLHDTARAVGDAIYTQESGRGRNAGMSPDRAFGPMQVIEPTFRRYARPGENWKDPADNFNVGMRYVDDLTRKFGGNPAAIAAAYFSGEGNVKPAPGGGYTYANRRDSGGKSVAGYVKDVIGRMGVGSAQAAEPKTQQPDLDIDSALNELLGAPEAAQSAPAGDFDLDAALNEVLGSPQTSAEAPAASIPPATPEAAPESFIGRVLRERGGTLRPSPEMMQVEVGPNPLGKAATPLMQTIRDMAAKRSGQLPKAATLEEAAVELEAANAARPAAPAKQGRDARGRFTKKADEDFLTEAEKAVPPPAAEAPPINQGMPGAAPAAEAAGKPNPWEVGGVDIRPILEKAGMQQVARTLGNASGIPPWVMAKLLQAAMKKLQK